MQNPVAVPQPPAPAAPPAPLAPAAPTGVIIGTPGGSGGQVISIPGAPARPLTAREMSNIRAQRAELSNQLTSAEGRRERLAESLRGTEGANRAGIESRIELLDKRILQLESDIAETGRLLTTAPVGIATTSADAGNNPFQNMTPQDVTKVSSLFVAFVMAPLAFSAARLMWKRAARPVRAPAESKESTERLDRIEQAVDAIAVEIERIGEGQRYVTRLFSEGDVLPALGSGQRPAEPLRVPDADAIRVRRERI